MAPCVLLQEAKKAAESKDDDDDDDAAGLKLRSQMALATDVGHGTQDSLKHPSHEGSNNKQLHTEEEVHIALRSS